MSILAAILAFLRSIPALAGLADSLGKWMAERDERGRIAQAAERKAAKDKAVDDRMAELARRADAARVWPPAGWVPDAAGDAGQLGQADVPGGLRTGSDARTGVDAGRAENDQRLGTAVGGTVEIQKTPSQPTINRG